MVEDEAMKVSLGLGRISGTSPDFRSEFFWNCLEMLACCHCNCIRTVDVSIFRAEQRAEIPDTRTDSSRSLVKHSAYILHDYQPTELAVIIFDMPIYPKN